MEIALMVEIVLLLAELTIYGLAFYYGCKVGLQIGMNWHAICGTA